MLGGQPGNSNSILPKINSFLVNTFFQSGSSNTAQIHPLQPGAIANTLGPSPKIAKKQPSKRKNSVGIVDTGKSLSEALILKSVNPQYDKRLFIEFPEKFKFTTCRVQILF